MSKSSQLRNKAQTFLKKGKVSEAIEAYKKLLQVESRNPNLYNELGDIYLRAEDRMQAVSSFEKAVDHYEKVALYNNAVAVCKKILRIVPSRLDSIYKLGELKAKQKFTGEASNLFIQYFDIITADEAGLRPEMVLPKVEAVIELVPDDEELHAKSAEVLTQVGLKISAAEVFARLIVKTAGNGHGEKTAHYRSRLELLSGSLTAEEQARIDIILAECGETGVGGDTDSEPDLTVEEIDPTAVAEAVGSDPEVVQVPVEDVIQVAPAEPVAEPVVEETPAAAEVPVEEPVVEQAQPEEAPKAEYEIPVEPEVEAAPAQEYVIPAEPDAEPVVEPEAEKVQEYEIPAVPVEPAVQEYEIPVEPVEEPVVEPVAQAQAAAPAEEYVIEEAADDEPAATPLDDDLSDILEAEDAAVEASVNDTENLVEDIASEMASETAEELTGGITSDVEEDDFRSHYDLGMAYIEMALYNEAIKELQISSRSEQLQLRSLEMIGHCFLLLENPRLAVKQLNRGLELAMNTGGDNLGIHYNLGLAYEALEETEKAREHFEEVYIVDVTFREISDKMKKYSTVS